MDHAMYIDGRWVRGDRVIEVENPATEEVIGTVPMAEPAHIEEALEAARRAQRDWARRTGVERGDILRRWAGLIEANAEALAALIVREQGKPLAEARGEVGATAAFLSYNAGFDRRIEGEVMPADQPNEQMWIVPAPVGVVVAITPWNYPAVIPARKIGPALICGNAVILKPNSYTPLAALELARLGEEAGIPAGVFQVVTGPGEVVGEALVRSPITRLVTFTGSTATGKRLIALASENVTVVSLELGGKAPFIVMDDADLDAAVQSAIVTRFINCGQTCICNERTYVHESVAGPFLEAFVEETRRLTVGDPMDPGSRVGPKISRAELEKVEGYLRGAASGGARVLVGGRRLTEGPYARGHWMEPTVLTDVDQSMPIMREEVFGPVVPVMTFKGFDDALALANDSRYGLAAYLFTRDVDRVMRAVRDLECGELYVNRGPGESIHGYHAGWKESGIGGDDGRHGLEHYLRRKTVYLRYQG
jgi:lactaldehyde dehydrogenase / glycolaldehyde dehydrogenase